MKLLLISNSTNAGEEYLRYPLPEIGRFLDGVREIVFVPYAAVTFSYADYEKKVQARFAELGIRVRSVHRAKDPAALVRGAEAICVGGGNTFALAKKMQQQGLMTAILRKIKAGTPYVGWSAGSNVCCPTICTTNDMPIYNKKDRSAPGSTSKVWTPLRNIRIGRRPISSSFPSSQRSMQPSRSPATQRRGLASIYSRMRCSRVSPACPAGLASR